MGIEPTRAYLPSLQNKRFDAMADANCEERVNFRVMRGNVGLRTETQGGRNLGQPRPPYFRSFDRYGSSKPCSLLAMKGRPAGNRLGILTTCNSIHSRMKRSR